MIFGDAGSTWTKVYSLGDAQVKLLPTRRLVQMNAHFDWGTGHTARIRSEHFENDLISLSRGALALIDDEDFDMLDLGSRDAKLVRFRSRRPVKLDWSVGCAAATGATLEMIGKFYEVDMNQLPSCDDWIPVTCGTYALERVMDAVSSGETPASAVARFVHGLARNVFDFSGNPTRLYLSGGFTLHGGFLAALRRYTDVVSMGRTVPLAGMYAFASEKDPSLPPMPEPLKGTVLLKESI